MKEMGHSKKLSYEKVVTIPNKLEIERCIRSPEVGPRILFFSGGNGLKPLSQHIINYSYNTIHLITSFDYGGSSAQIRDAFHMLSVGDIRNRIMALADKSIQGNPAIYTLFSYRLSKTADDNTLKKELKSMIDGNNDKISAVPEPMRSIIQTHLRYFKNEMPPDFNLQGASIGNLILTGGYLNNERNFDSVIFLFSKLVEARAVVRPITSEYRHLGCVLENGQVLIGQNLITGKEKKPIESKIKKIFLTNTKLSHQQADVIIQPKITDLIEQADLICYPIGSFYSSVLVNFLVKGVGQAIRNNPNLKIYIPNTCPDPEQINLSISESVEKILYYLKKSCNAAVENADLLNFVIIDPTHKYPDIGDLRKIEKMGIQIIETELVTEKSRPYADNEKLTETLLSLI